jgi:hypothetical protein
VKTRKTAAPIDRGTDLQALPAIPTFGQQAALPCVSEVKEKRKRKEEIP